MGSRPSKTIDFPIGCSLNFRVFSEPPSRGHFWRVKVSVYTQKYDLGAIFDFQRVTKSTFGITSSTKTSKSGSSFSWAERFGAVRGAACCPKRPEDILFSWILYQFGLASTFPTRYHQVLPDTTRYYHIQPDTTRYHQIPPDTTIYCQIQPDITRYYQIRSQVHPIQAQVHPKWVMAPLEA